MELTDSPRLSRAHEPSKTSMRNQDLFNYMSREHGLTLLESEMHEIELIVARMLAIDRAQEAARSGEESSCPVTGSANFASFGKEIFEATTNRVSGDEWMGEEDEQTMEIAAKHGLAQKVFYDPEKHGEVTEAEPGDPIWWWGSGEHSPNDAVSHIAGISGTLEPKRSNKQNDL